MKKTLLLIALLSMIVSCSTDNIDGTDGSVLASWDSVMPEISDDNYYLISEPGHLAWLADQPALTTEQRSVNKNIRLLSDIDMENKPFNGIEKFSGIFDGDNKSITNLNIDKSHNNETTDQNDHIAALIKESIGDVTIKYLNLDGGKIVGNRYIGAFIGTVSSNLGERNKLTIIKSTSNLELSANKNSKYGSIIGGFVLGTDNTDITITDSVHSGKITIISTSGNVVGGFIGSSLDSNIILENVINKADITNYGITAGLIGLVNSNEGIDVTTTITNSANTGNITSTDANIVRDPESYANNYAGGIIGDIVGTTLKLMNTYNSGKITSVAIGDEVTSRSGGLIAKDYSDNVSVIDSYNTGDINATSKISSRAGGIIGNKRNNILTITNSYNTGNITSVSSNKFGSSAGGIIAISTHTENTTITYTYNTGDITNTGSVEDDTGGLIGSISDFPYNDKDKTNIITITHSYNTGNIIGNGITGGVIGQVAMATDVKRKLTIKVSDIYNTGRITDASLNSKVGGIIGEIRKYIDTSIGATVNATIETSFNYGDIKTAGTNEKAGAIVGILTEIGSETPTYTNNFWYAPTTPTSSTTQTGGTYLSNTAFTASVNFTDWKIGEADSAWEMLDNAKYPTLKTKTKTSATIQ